MVKDSSDKIRNKALDSYLSARRRLLQFVILTRILEDFQEKETAPENVLGLTFEEFFGVLQDLHIGYFASLIDSHNAAVNCLESWRELFPEFKDEIDSFEIKSRPILELLREFRHVVAFHGNASLACQFRTRAKKSDNETLMAECLQDFLGLAIKITKIDAKPPGILERLEFIPHGLQREFPRVNSDSLAKYIFGNRAADSPD